MTACSTLYWFLIYYDTQRHARLCILISRSSHHTSYETHLNDYISGLQNPASCHHHLEPNRRTTYWNFIISLRDSSLHDPQSLLTYAPWGGQAYDVVAFKICACPLGSWLPSSEELIPSLRELTFFLLKEVKLVRLISNSSGLPPNPICWKRSSQMPPDGQWSS